MLCSCVQVTVPGFQGRCDHSSTAFNVSPGLTEVVLFGGCPELPSVPRAGFDLPQMANTTILQSGECLITLQKQFVWKNIVWDL